MEVSDPTTIYCDNLSIIQLAKNPVFHTRTKHIEVHYHFVYEHVLSGEVELTYVPTDRQNADIFTKVSTSCGNSQVRLGLRHLDVPNLRGREVPQDHGRKHERSGSDRDTSGRPKKPKADPRKSLKVDMRTTAERNSRSQPSMGEVKPTRASRQADRKGRGTRNRSGRGARARREAMRNRSDDPEEREEPQVELEGEC